MNNRLSPDVVAVEQEINGSLMRLICADNNFTVAKANGIM